MSAVLDHLVINARFELDEAARLFAGLGFTLTPRGHHSLGSINHLLMFGAGYIELIGLPPNGERLRQELLDSPQGLDGLVLASADPDQTYAELQRQGFVVQEVQHFSRPVPIDGADHTARFATVRLAPGQFEAGRVYFCHHETPELVWRPEWIEHANGVHGVARLKVLSTDPRRATAEYQRLGRFTGDFAVEVLDEARWREHLAGFDPGSGRRPERFAAITLRGGNVAELQRRAAALQLPWQRAGERLLVGLPRFETLLEFEP